MISIVIPTHNRPKSLERCLNSLVTDKVEQIVVIDDHSERYFKNENTDVISRIQEKIKRKDFDLSLDYIYNSANLGAAYSRNLGIACSEGDIVLFLDDDMTIPDNRSFSFIVQAMRTYEDVAIVGAKRIEVSEKAIDKAFYLNNFLADPLSKVLGFVFLNVGSEARFTEFVTSSMALRKSALDLVKYDPAYANTGYRDETDIQQACKSHGWKLLFLPQFVVYHYGAEEEGYHTPTLAERIYWKAHNHAYYLMKHFMSFRRYWYLISGFLILSAYSPFNMPNIAKGLRNGIRRRIEREARAFIGGNCLFTR